MIHFKAESGHGLTYANGIAKFSSAGIILEFESKFLGLFSNGVKEVRVSLADIHSITFKRGLLLLGPRIHLRLNSVAQASKPYAIEHGLTRSVRDSAALLDALAGMDCGAPIPAPPQARPFVHEVGTTPARLRVGLSVEPWLGHGVHDDCVQAVQAAATLLRELGHQVYDVSLAIERAPFSQAYLTVLAANVRCEIDLIAGLLHEPAHRRDYEAATWALGLMGSAYSGAEVLTAQRHLQLLGRALGRQFETFDVLLTPTLAAPPPPIGTLGPTPAERRQLAVLGALNAPWLLRALGALPQMAEKVFDFIPYTPVFNVTGQPAMSVPLHWNAQGLPIGVQFVGRFGDEATLLQLAGQLERARPWAQRKPALGT